MKADAVQLELFTNRFSAIATEMGAMLRRTAISTNIKERQDFSCALLDSDGYLVVNAPHIPVHLGALGLCVRKLLRTVTMAPGDTIVTNHPGFGGSHLPDITVVTPVFAPGRRRTLLALVANRAHHAEIGGIRPGSVPPHARSLAEEGVVIPPMHLIRGGEGCWDAVKAILEQAPYPSRAVAENLADLGAAVAANHMGAEALSGLATRFGSSSVRFYMRALRTQAALQMEEALTRLTSGSFTAVEYLDDGTPLQARISVIGRRAVVDLSGSGAEHPGNLNATPAIVHSVVLYVLRLLIAEQMPLNEGLLDPVDVRIPRGILNPVFPPDPQQAPAVVGGNVETSQRLVDTLLKALKLAACSQGTMNNIIFGDESYGFYETVAGGCGAGPGFHGASAVHSHMTNTCITDPEVVEFRYPVRVDEVSIRRGSGGSGRFRGGDGVRRELTFLRPASLSVLSQHRLVAPYGLDGGAPGAPGRQRVYRAGGEIIELGPVDGCEMQAGDRLVLETPGGGGWGAPDDEPANEDRQ